MVQKLLFLFCLMMSLSSMAATRAQFLGFQAMIQILPQDQAGAVDNDSIDLYQNMNVPVKDSPMGPGKAIVTADKNLNFICAKGQNGSQCTILIRQSEDSHLDPATGNYQYSVKGSRAAELSNLFVLKQGQYNFKSQDGHFVVHAGLDSLEIIYSENGL